MPRKGFKSITVPSDLYERIRFNAEIENHSIAEYLKKILDAKFSKDPAEDRSVAGSSPASGTFM
jgi:hypothetical protein